MPRKDRKKAELFSRYRKWSSQVEFIRLKKPIEVNIREGMTGFDVFNKTFGVVGSGKTVEDAMDMFFDHLMLEYYEHSLNPGVQSPDEQHFGKRLRKLFNTLPERSEHLVKFEG